MNWNCMLKNYTNYTVMVIYVLNVADVVIGIEMAKNGSFILIIHALLVMILVAANSVRLGVYLALAILYVSVIILTRMAMIVHEF